MIGVLLMNFAGFGFIIIGLLFIIAGILGALSHLGMPDEALPFVTVIAIMGLIFLIGFIFWLLGK